jgi:hypothetical protein
MADDALFLVDFQPETSFNERCRRLHHPFRGFLAADVDDKVVRVTDEAQTAFLQLFVKLVQYDIGPGSCTSHCALEASRLGGTASSRGPLPDAILLCRCILRPAGSETGSVTWRRRCFGRRGAPIRIHAAPGTQQLHAHDQSLLAHTSLREL